MGPTSHFSHHPWEELSSWDTNTLQLLAVVPCRCSRHSAVTGTMTQTCLHPAWCSFQQMSKWFKTQHEKQGLWWGNFFQFFNKSFVLDLAVCRRLLPLCLLCDFPPHPINCWQIFSIPKLHAAELPHCVQHNPQSAGVTRDSPQHPGRSTGWRSSFDAVLQLSKCKFDCPKSFLRVSCFLSLTQRWSVW